MARDDVDVVIVGGGAAGLAATRRLHDANVSCLLLEARSRLGGRAWTVMRDGHALDVGCGWLHSADRNPWVEIAERQGRRIDKTPPPWMRPSLTHGFPRSEQLQFIDAREAFDELVETAEDSPDQPAAALLRPGARWNELIIAVSTFVTGAELDRVSVHDLARYHDTGVNWRVTEGLGTAIAAYGAGLPVEFDCAVRRIDHGGAQLRVETAKGEMSADHVILALPTSALAEENFFAPALPAKVAAARSLPLGHDDKLFLALDGASELPSDSRLFGRTDRVGTGAYHLRPFGRPVIECYFGGSLARELEQGRDRAFFDFAVSELVDLLGSSFRRRLEFLAVHAWGADPWAGGAYSYALPGQADCRAALAQPIEERLFFAGEACSLHDFSTAHGAWFSGVAAADQVLAVRSKQRR